MRDRWAQSPHPSGHEVEVDRVTNGSVSGSTDGHVAAKADWPVAVCWPAVGRKGKEGANEGCGGSRLNWKSGLGRIRTCAVI